MTSRTDAPTFIVFLALSFAALAGGTALAQETYIQSIKPFNAALARICPEKHLEYLFPAQFDDVIEDFEGSLSKAEQAEWAQAAKPMCVESMAGISCRNIAYVRAATKLRKIDDLARFICNSGYRCASDEKCRRSQT